MNPSTPNYFSFLDEIPDGVIGFCGGIIIIVMFLGLNWNYLVSVPYNKIAIALAIYIASLFTGAVYSGKRDGALVAGVVAPIIYCTFATFGIRYYHYKSNKKDKSNYDHLID